MALPKVFVEALRKVPPEDLNKLCSKCKVRYKGERINSKILLTAFEKGDPAILKLIYEGISPVLMVGGMLPGVGLACNIIDAAFCFTIGAWLDFAIDIIAIGLFEVPGVSGLKGVSKGMIGLCRNKNMIKIDVKAFWKILDKLKDANLLKSSKVHELFEFLMSYNNKLIEFVDVKAIAKSVSEQNLFKWGNDILKKIISECEACGVKIVEKRAIVVQKQISSSSIAAPNLLSITEYKITHYRIK